jgi:hypothetical protein
MLLLIFLFLTTFSILGPIQTKITPLKNQISEESPDYEIEIPQSSSVSKWTPNDIAICN